MHFLKALSVLVGEEGERRTSPSTVHNTSLYSHVLEQQYENEGRNRVSLTISLLIKVLRESGVDKLLSPQ